MNCLSVIIYHFKQFKIFCKSNLRLIMLNAAIIGIVFGSRIFNTNISVDTDIFIKYPTTTYNWLDIGRWGLILSQKIFGIMWFNPYVECAMAAVTMLLFQLTFCYFIESVNKTNMKVNHYIFSALFITHPIFVFQWFFKLQAFEIAFSILLIAVALIFLFSWIENQKMGLLIPTVICMVWAFSCYQTNMALFICGALAGFLLTNQKDFKNCILVSLKLLGTFLGAFIINQLISKTFFMRGDYIDNSIFWGKFPVITCLRNIWHHMKEVLFGSVIMNLAFSVACLFVLIMFLLELKKMTLVRFYNYIVFGLLLISPFLLTIYLGSIPLYRSQYMLPFVTAFCFMAAYGCCLNFKKHFCKLRVIIGLLCISFVIQQTQVSLRLWYTEDIRYEQDLAMLHEIVTTMHQKNIHEEQYPIVFIGPWQCNLNGATFGQIEMIGISYFSLLIDGEPPFYHSTAAIARLAKTNGYNFIDATQDDVNKAVKYAENMPSYPNDSYIEVHEGIIVVKLSDDIHLSN